MSTLVTGGAGYLGSHAALALVEAGHRVVLLDDFSNSSREIVGALRSLCPAGSADSSGLALVEGDAADRSLLGRVLAEHSVDAVVHFAAHKSVPESLREPLLYWRNNVGCTLALADASLAHGVGRFVFSSSAAVYGSVSAPPVSENAPLAPQSPYGHTKAVCEQALRDAAASSDLEVVMLRYFNPLGAHPSGLIGDPSAVGRATESGSLLGAVTEVALGAAPRLAVFGGDYETRDGSGVRDFVHVMDVAEGHVAALEHEFEMGCPAEPGDGHGAGLDGGRTRVFNLGTGHGTTVLELAAAAEEVTGQAIPVEIADRRLGDISASWAEVSRAADELGWSAKRDLRTMLADHWRYVTQQRARS